MSALASSALSAVVPLLVGAQEKAPPDDEVVAGWTGFAVFIGLILAVAVLGYFLTKQLRRVDQAKADGVFGDPPAEETREDADGSDADGGSGSGADAGTGSDGGSGSGSGGD